MTYEDIANVYATQNPYLAAMHSSRRTNRSNLTFRL